MAGGLRLGLGYTFLVLGVLVLFVGAVLAGVSFQAEGEGQDCQENSNPIDDGDCESGSGSVSFQGAGAVAMIPGVVLLVAAAPLIVFGHKARAEARENGGGDGSGGAEG